MTAYQFPFTRFSSDLRQDENIFRPALSDQQLIKLLKIVYMTN